LQQSFCPIKEVLKKENMRNRLAIWKLLFVTAILITILPFLLILQLESKKSEYSQNIIQNNQSVNNISNQKFNTNTLADINIIEDSSSNNASNSQYKKEGQNNIIINTGNLQIPVIMYHHIDTLEGVPKTDSIGIGLRVSPTIFDLQMQYLINNNYQTILSKDLLQFQKGLKDLPKKPIILTFDDGYKNNFTKAYPILKKYNLVGEFAIITEVVNTSEYMSWNEIRELVKNGMGISSHTRLHCTLATKDPKAKGQFLPSPVVSNSNNTNCSNLNFAGQLNTSQIKGELLESKDKLENELQTNIEAIVYPFGHYNQEVINIAKEVGYTYGYSVEAQSEEIISLEKPFQIPRYRAFGQQELPLTNFFDGKR
jgi:peptidoglycan/xylan/chitin deacetylase (PgdA/CDA1 family)